MRSNFSLSNHVFVAFLATFMIGAGSLLAPLRAQAVDATVDAAVQSDDFNSCTLDPRWEFVNPLNDGVLTTNGTQVLLSVPAGTSHNIFDNGIPAPRIMQAVSDVDFEVVVKFESEMSLRFQMQGIIVEQDTEPGAEDFIRFDFYHDGTNLHVFAMSVRDGVPLSQIDVLATPSGADSYLKIRRVGNVWTESFSFDNVNYTARNFTLTTPFTVRKIGVFVANHGGANIPEHTAVVDYFFNTASPVANEDGKPTTLTINVDPPDAGAATVIDPAGQTEFACGDQIRLDAASNNGWRFAGWSGAATGVENPITFPYEMGAAVTANFVPDQNLVYLPLIRR